MKVVVRGKKIDLSIHGEKAYEALRFSHLNFCWGCGNSGFRGPSWWYGPWLIERAHIVNKPRKKDRRAVTMLCSMCHKQSHGEKYPENRLSPLTLENQVWLKHEFDYWWYDRSFMQTCSIRKLPLGHKPKRDRLELLEAKNLLGNKQSREEFEMDLGQIVNFL